MIDKVMKFCEETINVASVVSEVLVIRGHRLSHIGYNPSYLRRFSLGSMCGGPVSVLHMSATLTLMIFLMDVLAL
jgi:hypothetical protein